MLVRPIMFRSRTIALALAAWFTISPLAYAGGESSIFDEAQSILEQAKQFELILICDNSSQNAAKEYFHGWRVYGKTSVKAAQTRKRLTDAFKKGVAESQGTGLCFEPRHGIRASHNGKTADFLICFFCSQVKIFLGEKMVQNIGISKSPEPVFDQVLRVAGISLAAKASKK